MHDQHTQLRIRCDGFSQVLHGPFTQILRVPVPGVVHVIGQRMVPRLCLPSDRMGDKVHHRRGRGSNDALQDGIVRLLIGRVRVRVRQLYIRVIHAADLTLFTMHLAQVCSSLQPAAGVAHKHGIEPRHLCHLRDHCVGGGLVLRPGDQRARIFSLGVGDDLLHGVVGQLVLRLQVRCCNRRQRHHPRNWRQVPIALLWIQIRAHQHQPVHRHAELGL